MPLAEKIEIYMDKKQERVAFISKFPNGEYISSFYKQDGQVKEQGEPNGEYISSFYKQDGQVKEQGEPKNAKIAMTIREYIKIGEMIPQPLGG